MLLITWLLALTYFGSATAYSSSLITDYELKYVDYVWKSKVHKEEYIREGLYNHEELIPFDVDRSIDGKTFVTIVSTLGGNVPASLTTVSNQKGKSGSLLKPYPDWSWHEDKENCDGIINVIRVTIDKCNRLWLMDSGISNLRSKLRPCPARLFVFDVVTDSLLFKIVIPDDIAQNGNGQGLLGTTTVETYGPQCKNTTVYIADVLGYGLVVWTNGRMYRLEGDVFKPEKQHQNITVADDTFTYPDGIIGLSLSPVLPNGNRYLYFRALTSLSIYRVETRILRDGDSNSVINYTRGTDVFTSQVLAQTISNDGILFYGLLTDLALGCWNINKPLTPDNFKTLIVDENRLQFIQTMKIVKTWNSKKHILIFSDRLPKFLLRKMNFKEINFRILRVPLHLINNADCGAN